MRSIGSTARFLLCFGISSTVHLSAGGDCGLGAAVLPSGALVHAALLEFLGAAARTRIVPAYMLQGDAVRNGGAPAFAAMGIDRPELFVSGLQLAA